jgi:hypothetical protein
VTSPPLHRRSVSVETSEVEHDGSPALLLAGRLRDERPSGDGVRIVHDMHLDLTVRLADSVIVSAEARMGAFPHAECPFITPAFDRLVGLSVARGYSSALRTTLGGVSGCAHLYELARAMGASLLQGRAALTASRNQAAGQDRLIPASALLALRGTCHVWEPDGVGEQKVAAGWRPSATEYPAPLLEQLMHQDPP